MLYTRCYIVKPYFLQSNNHWTNYEGVKLAVQTPASVEELLMLFKAFAEMKNSIRIALCIDIDSLRIEEFIKAIIPFFFLQNYIKENLSPLILITGTVKGDGIVNFKEQLQSQGFSEPRFIEIVDNSIQDERICNSDNIPEMENYFLKKLAEPFISNPEMWIMNSNNLDILEVERSLKKVEDNFKIDHFVVYQLKLILKETADREARASLLAASSVLELENMSTHLKNLRSNGQASELQQFYNNEYEILPTWYKRLGHIIKIIMGKRTTKSLFNEDVKKYKD